MHINKSLFCFFNSCSVAVLRDKKDRSSVPEPNSAETEKAAHVIQPRSDLWAGETLPPAEISRVRGARNARQSPQNDRCSGQNLWFYQQAAVADKSLLDVIYL